MLVSAKEMLQKARDGKYAVGQFNINNLEWTKAILLTAQEQNSPVILGVSEGAGKYMTGFKTVSAMVKAMIEELNITVPVALHLDHGIPLVDLLHFLRCGFLLLALFSPGAPYLPSRYSCLSITFPKSYVTRLILIACPHNLIVLSSIKGGSPVNT